MLYRRLDPTRAFIDEIYAIKNVVRENDTAPTGDVGVRGTFEAFDPTTGVSTLFGQLPDGTFGIQEYVNDVTPPEKPSTPTGEPTIGGAIIFWNGLDYFGAAQPKDYARTMVQYSKDSLAWTDATTIYDKTTTTVGGLEIGVPHVFRLVSFDRNGNESVASETVSVTPTAMQDNEDVNNAIAELRAADVTISKTASDAAQAAQDAIDDLADLNAVVVTKVRTFTGTSAPVGLTNSNIGDLWIDGSGKLHRWQLDAGVAKWVLISDNGTAAADTALSSLGINQTWVNTVASQADKAITTFFGTTAPTGMAEGDLWLTGVAGSPMKRYTSNAWVDFEDPNVKAAYARAGTALDLADTKIKTFAQSAAPTGLTATDEGDLWIDTDNGQVHRWTGSAWSLVTDNGVTAANSALSNLGINQTWVNTVASQSDKAITTFYGTITPTGMAEGDLWLTGVRGTPMKRFTSNTWINFEDPEILEAYDLAGDAKSLADQKVRTFAQTAAPTGLTAADEGDLWINTSDSSGKVSRWSGSDWILVADGGSAAATNALANLGINQTWVNTVASQADKAISTFYGTSNPTGMAEGDLWLSGAAGVPMKRYTNGAWTTYEDPNVQNAYQKAADAESLADQKIRTFAQTTAPTGLAPADAGDLWINTSTGSGAVSRWSGTDWILVSNVAADLTPLINAKGKVIIQSAEPATADRLAQNLWIDTTSIGTPSAPGNIPKRWNGTAWVAVTEKAIIDAAKAAVDAQGTANDALRDAGLAMTAAGERSRVVHLNVTPPIPTGGWKDEDVWYKHSTVDIASPVIEWYRWRNGGWVKQVMDETFLPLVNIGNGTYGSLKGNRIEARSIQANQLVVADFENLWQNPGFEDDVVGQQPAGILANADAIVVAGGVNSSGKALSIKGRASSNNDVYDTNIIAVKPGDQFFLSAFGKFLNTAGAAGSAGGVGFRQYGPTKAHLSWTTRLLDWSGTKNVDWEANPRTVSYTVPTGVYYIQPWATFTTNTDTTNAFVIDDVEIRRKNTGKLIIDGAIDGTTITGALIQSSAAAYTGIKLSANQLVAYDTTATATGETFRIDGATGSVTMKGKLIGGSTITGATITGGIVQTKTTGKRIVIQDQSYGSDIRFYPPISSEYASISLTTNEETPTGTAATDLLSIDGPINPTTGGSTSNLRLQGGGLASLYGADRVGIDSPLGDIALNATTIIDNKGHIYNKKNSVVSGTLANGWTNFGGGYPLLNSTIIRPGYIFLQGMLKAGTIAEGVPVGNVGRFEHLPKFTNNVTGLARVGTTNVAILVSVTPSDGIKLFGVPSGTSYVMINIVYEAV